MIDSQRLFKSVRVNFNNFFKKNKMTLFLIKMIDVVDLVTWWSRFYSRIIESKNYILTYNFSCYIWLGNEIEWDEIERDEAMLALL